MYFIFSVLFITQIPTSHIVHYCIYLCYFKVAYKLLNEIKKRNYWKLIQLVVNACRKYHDSIVLRKALFP